MRNSRLNIKINNLESPKGGEGFDEAFSLISADDKNGFFKLKEGLTPVFPNVFNGKLIDFPIPPQFQTLDGKIVNESKTDTQLIPLLTYLKPGEADKTLEEEHFCHQIEPDVQGTACTEFIQDPPDDSPATKISSNSNKSGITYFRTIDTQFPEIRGNAFLNKMVKKYNGKNLFFLPTVTPNNTVIYIVNENQKIINDLIAQYISIGKKGYIIALNGWIIYIDNWDAFFFFQRPVIVTI